jgi:hypothetical protein
MNFSPAVRAQHRVTGDIMTFAIVTGQIVAVSSDICGAPDRGEVS